jgi:hypothetical protein
MMDKKKVDRLIQLDHVEGAMDKFTRHAYRGYFTRPDIKRLLGNLDKALQKGGTDNGAYTVFKRLTAKAYSLTAEASLILEDIQTELFGLKDNYDNIAIRNPRSILEHVILERRKILGITISTKKGQRHHPRHGVSDE